MENAKESESIREMFGTGTCGTVENDKNAAASLTNQVMESSDEQQRRKGKLQNI